MADRRSDEPPRTPHRSLASPGAGSSKSGASSAAETQVGATPVGGQSTPTRSGKPRSGSQDRTQQIGAAYTSSARPDAPEGRGGTPTGEDRVPASPGGARNAPTEQRQAVRAIPPVRNPQPKRVRKARLRLTHVDPWSVMKTAFLLAVALGIVTVVAVGVVWSVLGAAGVWESINATVSDVVGETGQNFRIENYLGMSRVMGFTMIVAVVDVVLLTVIATLGAFLYNLAAALLGGIEVIFAEEDR